QNDCQQHRRARVYRSAKKTSRDWRWRDWPRARLGLEPAWLGSDDAGIFAADRNRLRSGIIELAATLADRAGHDVSSRNQSQRGEDRQRSRDGDGYQRKRRIEI